MLTKFLVLALIAGVCLYYSDAAPRKNLAEMSQKELAAKFQEFMHDDKEMAALRQLAMNEALSNNGRVKRQVDVDSEVMDAVDSILPSDASGKEPGFFDRAAKFVVEVLQRFLRWINTE